MAEKLEQNERMEAIISLAKRRGFVYQGSEIYGGLAGTWDYAPLGVTLKRNIERIWWDMFVDARENMYGIDAAILMNPEAWVASGHVGGFSDPLVECKKCKNRFRADHLILNQNDYLAIAKELSIQVIQQVEELKDINLRSTALIQTIETFHEILKEKSDEEIDVFRGAVIALIEEYRALQLKFDNKSNATQSAIDEITNSQKFVGLVSYLYLTRYLKCPTCSSWKMWDIPRPFNMMFSTSIGATGDAASTTYLRPETAGGMFVNYKNVVDSFHPKLPFGLAQIGKAFRNEIAPRDFIFRARELEQMEIEYFVRPHTWKENFEAWRLAMWDFIDAIGIDRTHVYELEVAPADRAHYSERTIDFEYDYPFGRKELYGLAYRTDFDLKSHQEGSKVNLEYFDEETKEKFLPHVIEPSFGVGRTLLAVLNEAYTEDEMGGEKRVYLKFNSAVAPVRVAVFPLLKNKPELVTKAREVYALLRKELGGRVLFDDNGNIGKRYRRQDEIGTPSCVTIDFDTLGETPEHKDTVTLRDRDSGKQERIPIAQLLSKIL